MNPKLTRRADGTYLPVEFDLGPSRTCPAGRPVVWNPNTRELWLTRGKTVTRYKIDEFAPDCEPGEEARAFACVKLAKNGRPLETHHVRVSSEPGRHTCDCAGFLSDAVRHGNARAWDEGGDIYPSFGCCHLDFVLRLVWDELIPQTEVASCSTSSGG